MEIIRTGAAFTVAGAAKAATAMSIGVHRIIESS
jgi:hypothetical protein